MFTSAAYSVSITTNDISSCSDLLKELKRIANIAGILRLAYITFILRLTCPAPEQNNLQPTKNPRSWLSPYILAARTSDMAITKLKERQNGSTNEQTYNLHVCTFNVNGQFYNPELDISSWIKPDEMPDIVVVG